MSDYRVSIVEDRERADAGFAWIVVHGLTTPGSDLSFSLAPMHSADGRDGQWPDETQQALDVEAADGSSRYLIGPELVGHPALLPGTPVRIQFSNPSINASLVWPVLSLPVRSKRARLINTAVQGNAAGGANGATHEDGPILNVQAVEAMTGQTQDEAGHTAASGTGSGAGDQTAAAQTGDAGPASAPGGYQPPDGQRTSASAVNGATSDNASAGHGEHRGYPMVPAPQAYWPEPRRVGVSPPIAAGLAALAFLLGGGAMFGGLSLMDGGTMLSRTGQSASTHAVISQFGETSPAGETIDNTEPAAMLQRARTMMPLDAEEGAFWMSWGARQQLADTGGAAALTRLGNAIALTGRHFRYGFCCPRRLGIGLVRAGLWCAPQSRVGPLRRRRQWTAARCGRGPAVATNTGVVQLHRRRYATGRKRTRGRALRQRGCRCSGHRPDDYGISQWHSGSRWFALPV